MIKNCCQTCRYGNNCPYGEVGIFCMKGYKFSSILELCSLFDDINIRDEIFEKRIRKDDFCCDDYEQINHNKYFTYND